jgi:hypothetical protein
VPVPYPAVTALPSSTFPIEPIYVTGCLSLKRRCRQDEANCRVDALPRRLHGEPGTGKMQVGMPRRQLRSSRDGHRAGFGIYIQGEERLFEFRRDDFLRSYHVWRACRPLWRQSLTIDAVPSRQTQRLVVTKPSQHTHRRALARQDMPVPARAMASRAMS